jgi:hypothetical protein
VQICRPDGAIEANRYGIAVFADATQYNLVVDAVEKCGGNFKLEFLVDHGNYDIYMTAMRLHDVWFE